MKKATKLLLAAGGALVLGGLVWGVSQVRRTQTSSPEPDWQSNIPIAPVQRESSGLDFAFDAMVERAGRAPSPQTAREFWTAQALA